MLSASWAISPVARTNYFILLQVIIEISPFNITGSISIPHLSASGMVQQKGGRNRVSRAEDLTCHASYHEKVSR